MTKKEEDSKFKSLEQFCAWSKNNHKLIWLNNHLLRITNSYNEALLLSRIIYWNMGTLTVHEEGKNWLAKKQCEWKDEIGLSVDQYKSAKKALLDKGLIEIDTFFSAPVNRNGKRGLKTKRTHIWLNIENLLNLLNSYKENCEVDEVKEDNTPVDNSGNGEKSTKEKVENPPLQKGDSHQSSNNNCSDAGSFSSKEDSIVKPLSDTDNNQSYQQPPLSPGNPSVGSFPENDNYPSEVDEMEYKKKLLAELEKTGRLGCDDFPEDAIIEEEPEFLSSQDSMRIRDNCDIMVEYQQFQSDKEYEKYKMMLIQKNQTDDCPF